MLPPCEVESTTVADFISANIGGDFRKKVVDRYAQTVVDASGNEDLRKLQIAITALLNVYEELQFSRRPTARVIDEYPASETESESESDSE